MMIASNLALLAGVLSHCLVWFNALSEPGNHFERQDEAYSHKANRCARSQGFSVNVKLFQKNIQWKGHEYTRDTLAEALGAEVSKRSLPMTAVRRAPFVVDVAEDVRCGPLLELFDMAEGLGFVVKGFNLLLDAPNAPHLDTNESVVLPRFQSSLPIAEREMELFACVITLLDDNVVMMGGVRYSCATSELTDELFFAIQAKCRRYKASCSMNSPARALLYASVNVSARRLDDVMVQCFNGGIRSFYAVGCSESGTDRRGLRCVRFDLMLPNGFYWGESNPIPALHVTRSWSGRLKARDGIAVRPRIDYHSKLPQLACGIIFGMRNSRVTLPKVYGPRSIHPVSLPERKASVSEARLRLSAVSI